MSKNAVSKTNHLDATTIATELARLLPGYGNLAARAVKPAAGALKALNRLNWAAAKRRVQNARSRRGMSSVRPVKAPAATSSRITNNGVTTTATPRGVKVCHSEMMFEYIARGPDDPMVLTVQPGLPDCWRWLPGQANIYQRYKCHRLAFRYVPRVATSTAGRISFGLMTDPEQDPPSDRTQVMNLNGSTTSPIWSASSFTVPAEALRAIGPTRCVRHGPLSSGANSAITCDLGRLIIIDDVTPGTILADIYVDYEFEFLDPVTSIGTENSAYSLYASAAVESLTSNPLNPANADGVLVTAPLVGLRNEMVDGHWKVYLEKVPYIFHLSELTYYISGDGYNASNAHVSIIAPDESFAQYEPLQAFSSSSTVTKGAAHYVIYFLPATAGWYYFLSTSVGCTIETEYDITSRIAMLMPNPGSTYVTPPSSVSAPKAKSSIPTTVIDLVRKPVTLKKTRQ
jgi:hypothetical protein